MKNNYIPERGDIVWLTLSPTEDFEQAGRRPCYILSPEMYNKIGLCLICPITSKAKGYAGEVELNNLKKVQGVVLTDHIRCVDWRKRMIEFIENTDLTIQTAIYNRVHALIRL